MIIVNFPFFLIAILPIWAIYRASAFLKTRKLNLAREIAVNIFFIYILIVVYLTFFPIQVQLFNWNTSINLIPIKKTIAMLKYGTLYSSLKNIGGNILLLAPLGIFLPMLFVKARNMGKIIMAGFLISVSIEAVQLMTALRISDIDDVILNTIGSLIGYIIYILIKKTFKGFSSLESLTEANKPGSLLVLSIKPIILLFLFTLPLCLTSFFQNTYSVLESYSLDQSVYSNTTAKNPGGKIEKIVDSNGYTIVLSTSQNNEGAEKIDVYIYRNVLFNRVVYIAQNNFEIGDNENAYSSLGIMINKGAMLNIVYGKNPNNLAAELEVTMGASTHNQSLSEQHYFVSVSTMETLNRGIKVKLLDSQGNNVTNEFSTKNTVSKI